MKHIIWALVFLFFSASYNLFAQYNSYPIVNYSPKKYNAFPQNWICVQDSRGILYFGNSSCIIEYDGSNWNKIPVTKGVAVRSLLIDSSGTIFVGSVGDFGYLEPQKNGALVFKSLTDRLSKREKEFSDIWKIHKIKDSVIFQSSENIFILKDKKISVISPQTSFASLSFLVNDEFVIRQREIGIMKLTDGKLKIVPESEQLKNFWVVGIIPYPKYSKDTLLVLTGNKGFFYILQKQGKIVNIKTDADTILLKSGVLGMSWYNDSVLFVTTRKGLFLLNNKIQIIKEINKTDGLNDEAISGVFIDKQNEVWLSTNNGISRVSLGSPFYYYDKLSGLNGNVQAIIIFKNSIYIGTTAGIFKAGLSNQNKSGIPESLNFTKVQGINFEVWNLLEFNNKLLVCTSEGLYEITDKEHVSRITKPYTNNVFRSGKRDNILYVAEKDGLRILWFNRGKWIEKKFLNFTAQDILNVAEDCISLPDNNDLVLWISTRKQGLFKLQLDDLYNYKLKKYDTRNGLPNFSLRFEINNNRLFFCGDSSFYFYDPLKDKGSNICFFKTHFETHNYVQNSMNNAFTDSASAYGKKWLLSGMVLEEQGYMYYQNNPDILWVGLTNSLVRYDANVNKNFRFGFNAIIRKVTIGKDSMIFKGAYSELLKSGERVVSIFQGTDQVPEIAYKKNSISFEYSAPFFECENRTQFCYKLVGYDTTWTTYTNLNYKQYSNLWEGEYTFVVKAKNIYGFESSESEYKFIILPPWYRTVWAYLFYFILFILLIVVVIKLNTVRHIKKQKQLEKIITERTAEIVLQKKEIEERNAILNQQNEEITTQREEIESQRDIATTQRDAIASQKKEITDSINYARQIQRTLLFHEERIRNISLDNFILLKPRDIVSGDFFLIKDLHIDGKNQLLIAASDCTGHGVPGAFMSMLGTAFLNEIINKYQTQNIPVYANLILNELRDLIINSLHQTGKEGEQKDGMDIALCIFDHDTHELQYSGAHNPLYVIAKVLPENVIAKEGDALSLSKELTEAISSLSQIASPAAHNDDYQLVEIKADRMPIGIYKGEQKLFTNHVVKLNKADSFYIFSDGFPDQFGGPKGKKFQYKKFKNLLMAIQDKSMFEQKNILDQAFKSWQGKHFQVDDVLVMGFRDNY